MNNQQEEHAAHDAKGMDMPSMEEHSQMGHDMAGHGQMASHGGHASHHAMMVADFRRRFWISLVISIPILVLSHQGLGFQPVIGSFKEGIAGSSPFRAKEPKGK